MEKMIFNGHCYFGASCIVSIVDELKQNKCLKPLVVSDKVISQLDTFQGFIKILKDYSIEHVIFTDVNPNPTIKNCKDGLKVYKENSCDSIIAFGGGSVMDCAKCIAVVANNEEFSDIVSLENAKTNNLAVPQFFITTTSGTASEVTMNYVITDEINKRKMVIVDPNSVPLAAFSDSQVLKTMPKKLTAATGMDALTHAIESYLNINSTLFSSTLSLNAISLISASLVEAFEDPNNLEAREKMALASYIAGMSFSNVGLGICHSLAHPLSAKFDIPHGEANALLLPHIIRYNSINCQRRLNDIAAVFGYDVTKLSPTQSSEKVSLFIEDMLERLKLPKTLESYGIKEEDIKELATEAFNDPCKTGNPRTVTIEEIENIYKQVLR